MADVGIAEVDRHGHFALECLYLSARGVLAGNTAFISGFMEQEAFAVDVAGNKDMALSNLHGIAVVCRYAALIQIDTGVLYRQVIQVGASSQAGQYLIYQHGVVAGSDP